MNTLQKKIADASQKYYSGETSDVSDAEFDSMMEQLKEQDPDNPILTQTGHGYDVNLDTTPGEKVLHKYGNIGSLSKCHNYYEYPKSLKLNRYVWASLKLDGLSIVLYYEKGKLVRALTRGSNNIGVDITEMAAYILKENVEIKDSAFTGATRGEIVMSYEKFEQFKKIHPDAMNPRNSAAGLKNSNKITSDLDFLDIVVYSVVGLELSSTFLMTYEAMIEWLRTNFTHVVDAELIQVSENMIDEMTTLRDKWYGNYPADGIVLSADELSCVDNAVLYDSVAFKFKGESAITEVIDVEWNLSKTKYLIPRIKLQTVQLSGTNVSYCTGHNAEFIESNGIGPGAKVEVYKSGEIIPYLDKVIERSTECNIPSHCPSCGSELKRLGVHIACPNRNCADFEVQDLLVWMKNIAPYDGLGDTLKLKFMYEIFGENLSVDKVYERGDIQFPPTELVKQNDFYQMYHSLFNNRVKLADAIKALNIPRFGDVNSRRLAQYPEQVMTLIYAAMNPNIRFESNGFENKIGEANCKSLMNNYTKFARLSYIQNNIIWDTQSEDKCKVAITGKLSVKRSIFEEELRNAGFTPGSIAKDTKFLITDNPDSSSDKNKKADKWGIIKISEQEFRAKYM